MLILKRRRQNQKFPSFQIFRFAAGDVGGGAANKNDRKFLDFATRELVERGRDASVIRQNPADFVRNTFELHLKNTAKCDFNLGGTFWLKSELFLTKIRIVNFKRSAPPPLALPSRPKLKSEGGKRKRKERFQVFLWRQIL